MECILRLKTQLAATTNIFRYVNQLQEWSLSAKDLSAKDLSDILRKSADIC